MNVLLHVHVHMSEADFGCCFVATDHLVFRGRVSDWDLGLTNPAIILQGSRHSKHFTDGATPNTFAASLDSCRVMLER